MPKQSSEQPHTQTSAPVDEREVQDVRDDAELPRGAESEDVGKPRIHTENMDEDIGD